MPLYILTREPLHGDMPHGSSKHFGEEASVEKEGAREKEKGRREKETGYSKEGFRREEEGRQKGGCQEESHTSRCKEKSSQVCCEKESNEKESDQEEGAGPQEGRQKEGVSLILRQLNRRVGQLSPNFISQVRGLSVIQLEDLGEALLDFTTEEDLQQWLNDLSIDSV